MIPNTTHLERTQAEFKNALVSIGAANWYKNLPLFSHPVCKEALSSKKVSVSVTPTVKKVKGKNKFVWLYVVTQTLSGDNPVSLSTRNKRRVNKFIKKVMLDNDFIY